MNILGIIPARAGSKRIQHKNIKLLGGMPLVCHTFAVAKQSKLLTRLIVSTNDPEVIKLAKENGIEVPFIRPEEYASDTATDFDWIKHAVEELAKQGWPADYVVVLRPTNLIRTVEDIDAVIKKILELKSDSVRSLTLVRNHPFWMKRLEGDYATPFIYLGKPEEKLRSQDLPRLYCLNGIVDIINVKNLNGDTLYGQKMGYILIEPERVIDIDEPADFEYAEFLVKSMGK